VTSVLASIYTHIAFVCVNIGRLAGGWLLNHLFARVAFSRESEGCSERGCWMETAACHPPTAGWTDERKRSGNEPCGPYVHTPLTEFGIPRKQAWSNSVSQFRRGAELRPVLHGTLGFLHAPVHRACNNNIATLLQLIRGEETLGFRNIIISVLMQLKAAMFTDSCMYAGIGVYKDSCESC
jgi:hypothetical protein